MTTEQYGAIDTACGPSRGSSTVDVEGRRGPGTSTSTTDGDVTAKGFLALVVVGVLATTVGGVTGAVTLRGRRTADGGWKESARRSSVRRSGVGRVKDRHDVILITVHGKLYE